MTKETMSYIVADIFDLALFGYLMNGKDYMCGNLGPNTSKLLT